MAEILDTSELVSLYECPDCGDEFTSEDTDSGTGNRSPCCGKFGSVVGKGVKCPSCDDFLIIEGAD